MPSCEGPTASPHQSQGNGDLQIQVPAYWRLACSLVFGAHERWLHPNIRSSVQARTLFVGFMLQPACARPSARLWRGPSRPCAAMHGLQRGSLHAPLQTELQSEESPNVENTMHVLSNDGLFMVNDGEFGSNCVVRPYTAHVPSHPFAPFLCSSGTRSTVSRICIQRVCSQPMSCF